MIEIQVKNYINEAYSKNNNVFGRSFWDQHVLVVAEYASKLADKIGGDKEVIQLAAYLHDIAAVEDFSTLSYHASASEAIAQKILAEYAYPQAKIDLVKRCILNHSTPIHINDGLIEEVCLSNADAISQIINPAYWFYFVYGIRKLSFMEGKRWLIDKVESNWNKLIDPAKELINNRYVLVKKSLEN